MAKHTLVRSTVAVALVAILSLASHTHAEQNTDDTSNNNDPSPAGNDLIRTPSYSQTVEDVLREMMDDFSHVTSLTESLFQHPLFSRPRFDDEDTSKSSSSSKPFSTWGSFGSLTRVSPRYEVIDDARQFQVKIDVPGFHFHELQVELESGGRVLKIGGTKAADVHETSNDVKEKETKAAMGEKAAEDEDEGEKYEYTTHTSTSFQQKFTLDPSVDTAKLTANLVNGVLEVRAPRKHGAWNKKHVPITQFDEDVWQELRATDEGEMGETKQAEK